MNKANINEKRVSSDTLFRILNNVVDKVLLVCLLLLICLFILLPIACIFFRSFKGPDGLSLSNYGAVWNKYSVNLWNSLFVGVLTAIICTILSVCIALFISTKKGFVRLIFMGLILITMVSPPFVSSLSYIQLYGRRGWITFKLLKLAWNPYNWWGVVWMQSISFVPLNALFLEGILNKLDAGSLQSARDLGAKPSAILRDIVLPLIKPGLFVCFLLSFVRSLADFTTPVIIGGRFSTIASEIYLQIIGYSNLEVAATMNMFLMVPSIAAFFIYRYLMKKSDLLVNGRVSKQERLNIPLHRSGIAGGFIIIVSLIFCLMMILQYGCIFVSGFLKGIRGTYSFTTEYLTQLLKYDFSTMVRSIVYALIVSLLGTLFAMCFSYYMQRRRVPGRSFWDCLATLPYMLPGSCFGIGYILAFNSEPLKLTGGAIIVIANMMFKQLPTSTKICTATLSQIPKSLELAVRDLGGGKMAVLRDVIFPGLRSAFLSCFVYNFSSSMTTAGAILFLINPGRKLAVFKLFDAVYSGEYALASLIATLIIIIVLLVEGLTYFIVGKVEKKHVS